MNQEQRSLIILSGSLLLFLILFSIATLWLPLNFLIVLLVAFCMFFFFVTILLYLRLQHNLDRVYSTIPVDSTNTIKSLISGLSQKIDLLDHNLEFQVNKFYESLQKNQSSQDILLSEIESLIRSLQLNDSSSRS